MSRWWIHASFAVVVVGAILLHGRGPVETVFFQAPPNVEVQIPARTAAPVATAVVNFAELAAADAQRAATRSPNLPIIGIAPIEPDYQEPFIAPGAVSRAPGVRDSIPLSSVLSPAPTKSFLGLDDIPAGGFSYIPPDTDGAVGASRIMTTLNNNYRILNKADGSVVTTVTMASFWSSLNPGGVFDPQTRYDPYRGRFIVSAVASAQSTSSSLLVGVSATGDPSGSWYLAKYAMGTTQCTGSVNCWADYPTMGFNQTWIGIGLNMFTTDGFNSNAGARMCTFDYATFAGGVSPANQYFVVDTDFTLRPVVTYSNTEAVLYAPNHVSSGGRMYRLNKITGTAGSPTFTLGAVQTHTLVGAWSQPSGNTLPQLPDSSSVSHGIDAGDSRIISSVFRNNTIWYSQTVGLPSGGAFTHTAVQWVKLDTSGTALDAGRIEDSTATSTNGGSWYAYPSLSVNSTNDMLLGFSKFNSTNYPSAAYAMRLSNDAAGTLQTPFVVQGGFGHYYKTFGGGSNRWGDYSVTQVDPADDKTFWTLQEYSKAPVGTGDGSGRWSTWWASVNPVAAVVFTDDPLVAGTTAIKAVHVSELRSAIQTVRARYSLGSFSYTDPTLAAGTTPIKAVHITEMRTALDEAFAAASRTRTTTYTTITAGTNPITTLFITQLRNALNEIF